MLPNRQVFLLGLEQVFEDHFRQGMKRTDKLINLDYYADRVKREAPSTWAAAALCLRPGAGASVVANRKLVQFKY